MVPVLSLQMTLVLPKVSTAGKRFTMVLTLAIRYMPMASAPVTMAGKASGTAATARLTAQRIMSTMGRCSTTMPTVPTPMQITTAKMPIHLPTLRHALLQRGLLLSGRLNHLGDFAKLGLHTSCCNDGFGSAVNDYGSSENHVVFVVKLSFLEQFVECLSTGADSPVNAASSTLRLKASKSLESAGTLSPV